MKNYHGYLRAVLLSVLAAFIIDAVINYDQYRDGIAARVQKEKQVNEVKNENTRNGLYKVTYAVYQLFAL